MKVYVVTKNDPFEEEYEILRIFSRRDLAEEYKKSLIESGEYDDPPHPWGPELAISEHLVWENVEADE